MNTRELDISNLSDEDAHLLHEFLLTDEAETRKDRKIKLFTPGDIHPYQLQTISFQGSKIFFRTKGEGDAPAKYTYTVYANKNFIGEGGYAKVYSASGKLEHIDGKMVYTKDKSEVIKRHERRHDNAKYECRIAQIFPETKTKKTTTVYHNGARCLSFNVMANIPDTDFSDTIWNEGQYTILQSLQLMISAWTDLKKIDNAGIIHRDIKPRNMRVDHSTLSIRILDFGLAREKEISNENEKYCGTRLWMSPEMIADFKIAGAASDVYSMGMVSRALFCDVTIIYSRKMQKNTFFAMRKSQYANNEKYPVVFKHKFRQKWMREYPSVDIKLLEDILLGATTSRPEHRSTIDEVLSALKSLQSLLLQVKISAAIQNDNAETDTAKDTYADCNDLLFRPITTQHRVLNFLEDGADRRIPVFSIPL